VKLDLKKLLMIVIPVALFLIIGIVLLASGGDKEVSPITQSAKQALEKNQKDKALEILAKGNEEGSLDAEGAKLFNQLKEQLYPEYLTKAQKAEEEGKYKVAFENYSKALMAIPDGQDRTTLEESVSRTEKLVKEQEQLQKEFNTYVETFQKALSDSNKLLIEFKSQLDGIETGSITVEQLVAKMKEKIPVSSEIISNLDNGLFIQNRSLLDLHKNVIAHINYQHELFLSSLEMTNANKKEMIAKLNDDFLKLKQEQVSLIQAVNQFAEDNHLELNLEIQE
jgi:tetratricopeptide (TPR) repeat protein